MVRSYIAQQAYGGLQPVVDCLVGIPSEVVFLLTRNCFSEVRPPNMPHERSLLSLISSCKPDCA